MTRETLKAWPADLVWWDEGIKEKILPPRGLGGSTKEAIDFHGEAFWARGYAVSTVGCAEEQMRRDIRGQEQLETAGEDEDGAFYTIVRTITLAALGAAHNRQAPRFAGAL